MKSVYSAVRTGSLNKAICASSSKGSTLQLNYKQKNYTLHCASHVCYRQRIKLDRVTKMSEDAVYRTPSASTGSV